MARALRTWSLLLHVTGCLSHLLSTPDHVMVGAGSSANFSCQSNIPNGISWYFKPLGGQLHPFSVTGASAIVSSGDGRTSTVQLHHVEKQFTGTYKCADKDAAAFAQLTVLDAGQSGSLTLCPADVVTTVGENTVLRVAGEPGSSLRWYRRLLAGRSQDNVVIYTGEKMDYRQVDERYYVAASRDNEKSLVILDVNTADAGLFTMEEQFSRQTARVNLVVIEPDSPRCRERKTVSEDDVEFVCELQYTGAIQPTVQWYLRHSNDPLDMIKGAVYTTNGKVVSRLLVSAADRLSWPTECHISFDRQSCGEPRPAYTRTLPCSPLDDGEAQWSSLEYRFSQPVIIVVATVGLGLIIVTCLLVVVCSQKCKPKKGTSTVSLVVTDSPPGVNRSESSDDNVIDPEQYDMLTQYENYPPPSEYEKLQYRPSVTESPYLEPIIVERAVP